MRSLFRIGSNACTVAVCSWTAACRRRRAHGVGRRVCVEVSAGEQPARERGREHDEPDERAARHAAAQAVHPGRRYKWPARGGRPGCEEYRDDF